MRQAQWRCRLLGCAPDFPAQRAKNIIQPQELPVMGAKEMLVHAMWLRHRLTDEYWTVVAQRYMLDRGIMFERLRMASILAPMGAGEKLLADRHWLTVDALENTNASGDLQTGMHVEKNITIEPFAFLMQDTGSGGSYITNDFIQFYNLRLDAGTYVAVDSACEDVDVVRFVDNTWHQEISVSTRFLRNYLVCRGRVLVRQHDNLARLNYEIDDFWIERFPGRAVSGPNRAFRLGSVDHPGDGATTRLLGKDLVMPFRERLGPLAPPVGHCEFVVGIDDQGREVTAAYSEGDEVCNSVLKNTMPMCGRPALYYGEDGMCKYCFPVRFRRDVLKKYIESDRHEVDYGKVSCAQWSVEAYIYDSGIVETRLGDLARLPACEQHYWRSYNVPPEGIGGRQYTGFGSMGVFSHGVGYGAGGFWKSFNNFQEGFKRMFGFALFMSLSADDAHRMGGISVPLSDDPAEFEGCIQNLAILLNDSIDVKQLRKKLAEYGPGVAVSYNPYIYVKWLWEKLAEYGDRRALKQIPTLGRFLERESLPTTIMPHLLTIQKLRSSGVVHPKGRKFKRIARKLELNDAGRSEFVRRLLADIAKEFDTMLPDTVRPRTG